MTTRGSVTQAEELRIITDGACRGNPGPGGWAALIIDGTSIKEIGGNEAQTTNNRMELQAAVEALKQVPPKVKVRILSDSQYLIHGATRWIRNWKLRNWQTVEGQPVEHRDLWEALDQLAGSRVTWEYVRGHAGHPENERVNTLAQAQADRQPITASPTRPPPAATSRVGANSGTWPCYLSLVQGQLQKHQTWEECRTRVHGVSGAKYKKVASIGEAQSTLRGWGLNQQAIDALL